MAQSSSSSAATTTPQFVGINFSTFCSVMGRPLVMTGVFREILIRHFAHADYIEEPDLKKLIWRENTSTGIKIESVHRWRPELTEFRPAVMVKRNAYQNQRRGIGDRRQGPHTDQRGTDHYVTYWVGSHTMFCISRTGAHAELLGSEVQHELTEFGPAIAKSLNLLRFQATQVGAVARLAEARENWVVPVTVGYAYEQRWTLRQQAPRLKTVAMSLITDC